MRDRDFSHSSLLATRLSEILFEDGAILLQDLAEVLQEEWAGIEKHCVAGNQWNIQKWRMGGGVDW